MHRFFKMPEHKKEKRKRKPVSPMRWLAAIFVLVIIGGLFLTVRPLRDTAQQIIDTFYPPQTSFFQATEQQTFGADETEPRRGRPFHHATSLEEAFSFYDSQFLILPEENGITISHIAVDRDALLLIYHVQSEQEANGEYPSVISLYQLELPDGLAIPMTVAANDYKPINVRINGSAGVYVQSGLWSLFTPIYEGNWQYSSSYQSIGNAHRLAWQDGDIVYVLTMSENLADSVEDVVAVAESLIPYVPEDS